MERHRLGGLDGTHGRDTEHIRTEQARQPLVMNTLAQVAMPDENLSEVAHDARNMVTALGLYCDLLRQPGVLAEPFRHYAGELQMVTAASHRLVDKLAALDTGTSNDGVRDEAQPDPAPGAWARQMPRKADLYKSLGPAHLIDNLAEHLLSMQNLLAALACAGVHLHIDAADGAQPVHFSGEDLTRVLVNLVKNAAEAMRDRGRISIRLGSVCASCDELSQLLLTVEDNGPGFPDRVLEVLAHPAGARDAVLPERRTVRGKKGLGLRITRSLVEHAGGSLHVANRDPVGACVQIELPVRSF